jgi:hypothetical protein
MKRDEAMDLLREAHREPIPEAHFAAVRARVLSQIVTERGVPRRRIWPWVFAVVSAAALLLAFWPKQAAPKRVVADIPARIEKPLADARVPVRNRDRYIPSRDREGVLPGARITAMDTERTTIRHTHRKPLVTRVIGPPNPTPLVVKMLTDDPNVVIYWISERTGE